MQLVSFLRKTKTCGIVGRAAAIHVLLILHLDVRNFDLLKFV